MIKYFGVTEAIKAGEFAKTREQKLTVLAVVKMMSIPVRLKDEVVTRTTRLVNDITRKVTKIDNLSSKIHSLRTIVIADNVEKDNLRDVQNDWDIKG